MNRREFIKALGYGYAAALLTGRPTASGGSNHQREGINVLVLMMDQHHHAAMSCAGNPVIKTPNIDRLAREGVRFSNAVCATPYCSPTRASLVTGRWPHSTGIVVNCTPGAPALTTGDDTTEDILFDKGYATEQIGKWHLGAKSDFRCYESSLSMRDRMRAHRDFLRSKRFTPSPPRDGEKLLEKAGVYTTPWNHATWEKYHAAPAGKRKGQDLMAIGRQAMPAEWELWGQMASDAVEWLQKNRTHSFMLTYSAGPPHALWTAPDPWYSMYDPATVPVPKTLTDPIPQAYTRSGPARKGHFLGEKGFREMIRCYYAQVTMIDTYIGRILDALDETGLAKNTLVIYISDHGDMQGLHGGMLGKSLPAFYEEIVRVPMMMRLPGVIPAGKVVKAHANSVDLCPTILDYLGANVPKTVQGQSLRPVIEGRRRDEVGYGFSERPGGRMIRAEGWKYCLFFSKNSKREELYDLRHDPTETRNLADDAQYAEQKSRLRQALVQHMVKTTDNALARKAAGA